MPCASHEMAKPSGGLTARTRVRRKLEVRRAVAQPIFPYATDERGRQNSRYRMVTEVAGSKAQCEQFNRADPDHEHCERYGVVVKPIPLGLHDTPPFSRCISRTGRPIGSNAAHKNSQAVGTARESWPHAGTLSEARTSRRPTIKQTNALVTSGAHGQPWARDSSRRVCI